MTGLSTPISVEAGRVLARQGAVCREFMVIADGTANVNRNGYDVDELGPGDAFGEISLVLCVPNPTTITSVSAMRLQVMNVREFRSAYNTMPAVLAYVDEQIDARVRAWLSTPTKVAAFPARPMLRDPSGKVFDFFHPAPH